MRPTRDQYFLAMAHLVATRATCFRRSVGCVLTNARGHVLSTGYNGRQAGAPHCNENVETCLEYGPSYRKDGLLITPCLRTGPSYPYACAGATALSGDSLDACEAVHAEQNALLQCRDVWAIETCYTTTSPCVTCAKLLLNTACARIVYADPYAAQFDAVSALWAPRELTFLDLPRYEDLSRIVKLI